MVAQRETQDITQFFSERTRVMEASQNLTIEAALQARRRRLGGPFTLAFGGLLLAGGYLLVQEQWGIALPCTASAFMLALYRRKSIKHIAKLMDSLAADFAREDHTLAVHRAKSLLQEPLLAAKQELLTMLLLAEIAWRQGHDIQALHIAKHVLAQDTAHAGWRFHAASIALTVESQRGHVETAQEIYRVLTDQERQSAGPALAAFTEAMLQKHTNTQPSPVQVSEEHFNALDSRRQEILDSRRDGPRTKP